ncbi:carboxymuconolactone decarboxylase family protein [Lactobacillus xylocopicola]|uniref:Carboxymuconolactone decarboxylase-like domain-containing protein n=1 Tax=Lactobacillus xylocopicola TaxID=2976676 RepID=A0ABM8BFB0_9LACO|nr:carboxymuconolactone decarboxylase family protein [Lactobacillus xylocopicola]BDR59788.1 hypothetical protein KIM322_00490 [Lactobacillus xylocopicola]
MTTEIEMQYHDLIKSFLADVNTNCASHLHKDRVLIPIIASITQGITTALADQVETCLAAGIEPEILLEVVYQLTPVAGTLKVQQALPAIQAVLTKHQFRPSPSATNADENYGASIQADLYGTEIKNLLKDLPDEAGDFVPQALTNHFFNDFYNRSRLDVRDRERYELLALITLNVDFQIKAHARGSLRAGNSESELVWATIQLLPYIGFPLVINSVQVIHQAVSQSK